MEVRNFPVNKALLADVHERLSGRDNIYWIVGGSCSGKSTVSTYLSREENVALYDMDAHMYGDYMEHYCQELHPATYEWFHQPSAFEWALSLSWPEFDSLNEATNVEILDVFTKELSRSESGRPLLVDGGLAHPRLLIGGIPPSRIICVTRPQDQCVHSWETDEVRASMKQMVLGLPGGEGAWERFLDHDRLMTQTLIAECRLHGIRVVDIDGGATVEAAAEAVRGHFRNFC